MCKQNYIKSIFQKKECKAPALVKFPDENQKVVNQEEKLTKMAHPREKRNAGEPNPEAIQTETGLLPGERNKSGVDQKENQPEMNFLQEEKNDNKRISV